GECGEPGKCGKAHRDTPSFKWKSAQCYHMRREARVKDGRVSEHPVLFAEGSEAAHVGDGKRDAEEGVVALAGVEAAELDADAAAIGVVSDLRSGIADEVLAVIVDEVETGIDTAAIGVAIVDAAGELVGGGGEQSGIV